ncbi:hypothetical protein DHEL01_v206171 [Diaporthe helianthi]|uniref:Cytochrome P450 n=1 Tax=Diaporthe helianthi TaxID=158607 RepID=A0A2P5HYX9_DIAHE|nr:hypothetical protein DHEL01_v206171 [Diaporthe helianthi]
MHRTTSRVLAGPELCRDEDFLKTSQTFTDSLFINGLVLSMLPLGPCRRWVAQILSFFHKRNLQKAMNVIFPVVNSRFESFQTRDVGGKNELDEALDAIQWSLELSEGNPTEHNPQNISSALLHNIWAGSAAPGGLATQLVFQVLTHPEYLEPLRAEAQQAIQSRGLTDKALNNMYFLDSFIREVNRLYPTGAVTCARTVMNPSGFRLHDGLTLAQGDRIAVPALAIQTSSAFFSDPLSFDGFRFSRLSAAGNTGGAEDVEQKWGAATVSDTNLA